MRKAFLETSALDHAHRAGLDAEGLGALLEAKDLRPALGLHVIYEVAHALLSEESLSAGVAIFSILRDMDLSLLPPPDDLLRQELLSLRTNSAVLPFMDGRNQASTRQEIVRLACGEVSREARAFIANHDAEVSRGHPKWADSVIQQAKTIRRLSPAGVPRFQSSEDLLEYFRTHNDGLANLIRDIFRDHHLSISRREAIEFVNRLPSFPAVACLARSQCYLNFICLREGHMPAFDKLGDYRHVVEAAYCQVFLTADRQLSRTAPRLNPNLEVILFAKLL